MTDVGRNDAARPSLASRRVVLGALVLGLAAILGASVVYRLQAHPLTRQAVSAVAANKGMPMPPAGMGQGDGMTMPPPNAAPGGMPGADAVSPEQAALIEHMKALQADPNNVEALLDLADAFIRQENPESAQGFINRALVAAPGDARPSYYQGVLFARQGKYPEAAEAMERSLKLRDNPSTRYSLAVIYRYHLNDPDKARQQLEAARVNPGLTPDMKTLIDEELAK